VRVCGECTLCCKLPAVPEFNKPTGEWCRYCNPKKGCQIYTTRPESCKNFQCLWLLNSLPDYLRPDKSGVIFESLPSGKTFIALLNPGRENTWKTSKVKDVIESFLQSGKAVVVSSKPPQFFVPFGRSIEEVKEELLQTAEQYGYRVTK